MAQTHPGTMHATPRANTRDALGLAAWLAISFLPAIIGALIPPDGWYASLAKPTWNPPAFVFGPVWTFLYATLGVSAWLLWRRRGLSGARGAFGLFAVQLALNAAWPVVFFGLHRPGYALATILLLWLAIAATIAAFARHHRPAAWLLAPYLLWVTYASALSFAIWRLNS